jgi:hypothetical protein
MKTRLLLVLLALPLVAFDCGGEEKVSLPQCPFGCTMQVRGAVSESLCCLAIAYDYSQLDPTFPEWTFMLTAFRTDLADEAASVGMFFEGRPPLAAEYAWDGDVCSTTALTWGTAERFTFVTQPYPSVVTTHSADSALGTGALSLVVTEIVPSAVVGQQSGVHGALTATLPPGDIGFPVDGPPVTLFATF